MGIRFDSDRDEVENSLARTLEKIETSGENIQSPFVSVYR